MDWAVDTTDLVTDVFGGVKGDQFANDVWRKNAAEVAELSTALMVASPALMTGCAGDYWLAGWNMTSVFLRLTVSPNRTAVESDDTRHMEAILEAPTNLKLTVS